MPQRRRSKRVAFPLHVNSHWSCVADEPDSGSSPSCLLQSRLEEALRADVAVTTDLRLLVRASMDALRAALGEAGWQAAVEGVEPVVLGQLRQMVA